MSCRWSCAPAQLLGVADDLPRRSTRLSCRSHPFGWGRSLRVRLRFQKLGKVRFVGHRDVARIFERTLRKIGFPVTYSEGFSPRVKLSFGLALPTCYESVSEYLDIPIEAASWVDGSLALVGQGSGRSVTVDELVVLLCDALPNGFDVTYLAIEDRGGPSLQEAVVACSWEFDLRGCSIDEAVRGVDHVLGSSELMVERNRKGKTINEDIRPAVYALHVDGESERGAVVVAELSASPRVVRPSELLGALAPGCEMGVARRRQQWIEREGARGEPLPPATTRSTPTLRVGTEEGTPA